MRRSRCIVVVVVIAVATSATSHAHADAAPVRLNVRFDDASTRVSRGDSLFESGVDVVRDLAPLHATIGVVDSSAADAAAAALRHRSDVLGVERDATAWIWSDVSPGPVGAAIPGAPADSMQLPGALNDLFDVIVDPIAGITLVLDDLLVSQQWGLRVVGAQRAWSITRGSSQHLVAVLDTGVDDSHLDLQGKVVNGHDWVSDDDDPADDAVSFSHGTHVAGIVAAVAGNGLGIAGVAPESRVLAIRVLGVDGSGSYSDIASGIVEAADAGAVVINLSLGGRQPSELLRTAVEYAAGRGSLVTCAAGNDSATSLSYPAAYDACLAVGATDASDARASFSNTGDGIDLTAPGVGILSTVPAQLYMYANGTSMATPFVSGAAALLRSRGLDAAQASQLLASTAADLGPAGYDTGFGAGRIDVAAAVERTVASPPTGPAEVPAQPTSPSQEPVSRTGPRVQAWLATRSGVRRRCGSRRSLACRARVDDVLSVRGRIAGATDTIRRVTIREWRLRRGQWVATRVRSRPVGRRGGFAGAFTARRGVWRYRAIVYRGARPSSWSAPVFVVVGR